MTKFTCPCRHVSSVICEWGLCHGDTDLCVKETHFKIFKAINIIIHDIFHLQVRNMHHTLITNASNAFISNYIRNLSLRFRHWIF